MSKIRVKDMPDETPIKDKISRELAPWIPTLPWRAVGLLSLGAGLALWMIGARYTLLGGPDVIAFFFGLFGIDLRPELPAGWLFFGLTVLVGLVISLAEFGVYPRRSFFADSIAAGVVLLAIWLLSLGVDLASTYVGVTTVQAGAGAAGRWVAATSWAAGTWTIFLTFCPELFILGGVRWLFTGRL